jgi:hypothetical protein
MSRKRFTDEELALLQESPYVIKVTRNIVNFSAEFKKKFWESICLGETMEGAVTKLGIDPKILGFNRIYGLKNKIWDDIQSGRGFTDITENNKNPHHKTTAEQRIKQLEHQLAYKEQEIEFLKKIASLGRGEPES